MDAGKLVFAGVGFNLQVFKYSKTTARSLLSISYLLCIPCSDQQALLYNLRG